MYRKRHAVNKKFRNEEAFEVIVVGGGGGIRPEGAGFGGEWWLR